MKPVRLAVLGLVILIACRKEIFTTSPDALLYTSTDSLHFDTVFTTTGSTSQFIKIINDNNRAIRISTVRLAGGSSSPFRINVDGFPGPEVSGVEVGANDSTYIYVTVSIDPTSATLPFIVQDSIEILYNGNVLKVHLDAFGQNAHFLRNATVSGSDVWDNDLPYVILERFTIDTNAILSINPGVRVHIHGDAPFIVHGTLKVNGGREDSLRVIFTGDRLDEPYRDFPASYPGLIFTGSSRDNEFKYAIIRNAYQGILAFDPAPGVKITLRETIIDNAYDAGILGVNTSISATNVLISNCGTNVFLLQGGNYDFNHCTMAAYSNAFIQHRDPVFVLTNYLKQGNILTTSPLTATFRNCIIWGESGGLVEDEVIVAREGTGPFNVSFTDVLWRLPNAQAATLAGGTVLTNVNPGFDSLNHSKRYYDFRLRDNSPALEKGSLTGVNLDLDGNPRPVGLPDLGAYEKQ